MICGNAKHPGTQPSSERRSSRSRGFSLLELVIVVAVALTVSAIAIPVVQSSMRVYALRSAVASLTGAIQSTRYQAIFHGCQYQLAVNAVAYNYQVSSQAPAAGGTACTGAFAPVGNPVPLAGSGMTLNTNVTLVFHPSGQVQATVGALNTIVLTQAYLPPETIQVSNYGRILVTP